VQVATIDGYTWKFIAQTQSAMWPFSESAFPGMQNGYQAAFQTTTPPPGAIKFSSNEKNQEMIFWARENNDPAGAPITRYFITDQWGNQYIMGAAGDNPAGSLDPSNLPIATSTLDDATSLFPAYGAGSQAHFNLFRDSADNTFFQTVWGTSGHSIAEQISGMPIWSLASDDRIYGRNGDDNLIHGAEGTDEVIDLGQNDILYGDDGSDTVLLSGDLDDYTVLDYANGGATVRLEGFGFEKDIYDVEYLQFDDQTLATSAIPEPAPAALAILGLCLGISRRLLTPRRA